MCEDQPDFRSIRGPTSLSLAGGTVEQGRAGAARCRKKGCPAPLTDLYSLHKHPPPSKKEGSVQFTSAYAHDEQMQYCNTESYCGHQTFRALSKRFCTGCTSERTCVSECSRPSTRAPEHPATVQYTGRSLNDISRSWV